MGVFLNLELTKQLYLGLYQLNHSVLAMHQMGVQFPSLAPINCYD